LGRRGEEGEGEKGSAEGGEEWWRGRKIGKGYRVGGGGWGRWKQGR